MSKVFGFRDRETAERLARTVRGPVRRTKKGTGGGHVPMIAPSEILFNFTLNAAMSGGVAEGAIADADGVDLNVDAQIFDPQGIFAALGVGATGLCIRQKGRYYAIQANCPVGT